LASSKSFGKLTAKQKLKQALEEFKAQVPRSDTSVKLFVEHQVKLDIPIEEFNTTQDKSIIIEQDSIAPISEDKTNPAEEQSILSRAYDKPVQIFQASAFGQTVSKVSDASFSPAVKSSDAIGKNKYPAAFGSALKKSTSTHQLPLKKPSQTFDKNAETKDVSNLDVESNSESVESDMDSQSDHGTTEKTVSLNSIAENNLWKCNVISGEQLPQPTVTHKPKQIVDQIEQKVSIAERAFFVPVNRTPEIQMARISLPVVGEEQQIMEKIMANDVVVLCGETGSGKTTQVPQFLYEAGFGEPKSKFPGMVAITQPRRVAAISMASRVASELNTEPGVVSYQVRYDKTTVPSKTRIIFMTDGILLRELSGALDASQKNSDLLLSKYSCIIIDEAHERTVGTDVLIGWLSRIVKLRNSNRIKNIGPLKLIIMSATLRVQDFVDNDRLFPEKQQIPPVINVEGRQHKVVIHYNKITREDYISDVFNKAVKIHTKLPVGGILIFVTGQKEVDYLVRRLSKRFPFPGTKEYAPKTEAINNSDFDDHEFFNTESTDSMNAENEALRDDYEILAQELTDDEEENVQILGDNGLDDDETNLEKHPSNTPLHVLPLYSMLPKEKQLRVFQDPRPGARLVIVSTNVAETSLTIPGIRYVIDCGKSKEKVYNLNTGSQNFQVKWVSKASADQRAGRAGRMGPGHCYRLYSSAVFNNHFNQFSQPEILIVPKQDVILQMKAMGINQVLGFPFPTSPDRAGLGVAEKLLVHLGALENTAPHKITEIGKKMAQFPISARYGKMLTVASKQSEEIFLYTISLVSCLSVGDIFVHHDNVEVSSRGEFFKAMQIFSGKWQSDVLAMLQAIGSYSVESVKKESNITDFCSKYYLRQKAMDESLKLVVQLRSIAQKTMLPNLNVNLVLMPPSKIQAAALKQIILSGYVDQVARLDESQVSGHGKTALPIYQTMIDSDETEHVVHSSSSLYRLRPPPKWVVYDRILGKEEQFEADGTKIETKGVRKYLAQVTVIEEEWLSSIGTALCNLGRILDQPEATYKPENDSIVAYRLPTYGTRLWQISLTQTPVTDLLEQCTVFAKCLLQGKVPLQFNAFQLVHSRLVAKPTIITKPWAKSQPRVHELVKALYKYQIQSRKKLEIIWYFELMQEKR
jgi:ATP-dependent RNA helicase DHX37/DHR1